MKLPYCQTANSTLPHSRTKNAPSTPNSFQIHHLRTIVLPDCLIPCWECLILNWKSLIPCWKCLILNWKCLILNWKSRILNWECLILNWKCLTPNWKRSISSEERLILDWEYLIPSLTRFSRWFLCYPLRVLLLTGFTGLTNVPSLYLVHLVHPIRLPLRLCSGLALSLSNGAGSVQVLRGS
jgi:hypothetical protein